MLTFPNIDEIEKKCKELMIKTIAKNLRNIRLSRRFSQEEVSVRAGISAKHVQNLEAGKKSPSARTALQLAKALGVGICQILPTDHCPRINGDMEAEINKLFTGKEERDIQKAIKILGVFFS